MSKPFIYMDNAATTKVAPQVLDAMMPYFSEIYANGSSVYQFGQTAKEAIETARAQAAALIGAKPEEIYFTGGGSESDNWAIKNAAEVYGSKGKHIITSNIEHHAVLHTCQYLEKHGYEVTYLPVDSEGRITPEQLEAAIRPDTILVSIMTANNEIGTIEPIKELGRVAHEHGVLFHTDAVQAYGHIPINVDEMNIDMLSSSGHKINGPKGSGFIYIKKNTKINPIILGGGQQMGFRSGTENVPGIAGIGQASKDCYDNLEHNVEIMTNLKDKLIDSLEAIEGVTVNSRKGNLGAPHIVSASFKGVRSEVLLHALEDKGIYISAGSACSSNRPAVSSTLKAMGIDKDLLESTVRFSFCEFNTEEEVDYAVGEIKQLLPILRKYVRR